MKARPAGLVPPRPALTATGKLRRLARLPTEARRLGPAAHNHTAWALLSSKRAETELGRSVVWSADVHPFRDRAKFPDLGPYDVFRDWQDQERVMSTSGPAWIDPDDGWTILSPAHRVEGGVLDIEVASGPRIGGFVRARAGRCQRADELVNLRDRGERNYAHFLTDLVGGRLRLADRCGLQQVPVLVGDGLYRSRLFKDFLRLSGLNREFVVQSASYVRAGRAHLFDVSHYSAEGIGFVHDTLAVPSGSGSGRVMIARRPGGKSGRGFLNMGEVADVCKRLGFTVVETDDLALDRQIEIFSQTEFLVGSTGAALSNLMFRRQAPCTVLEIFPPGVRQPRPWWFFMAVHLGHRYEWMRSPGWSGAPASGRGPYLRDYHLDVGQLESRMRAMLESGH